MEDNLLLLLIILLNPSILVRSLELLERPGKEYLLQPGRREIKMAQTFFVELVDLIIGSMHSSGDGVDLVDEVGAIEDLKEEVAVSEVVEDEETRG